MTKKTFLIIIITHPVQYFSSVFRALAAKEDLDILVIFACDHGLRKTFDVDFSQSLSWDNNLLGGYKSEFLSTQAISNLAKPIQATKLGFLARNRIKELNPDAVLIYAYSPLFITISTLLLRLSNITLLLRADGTDSALPRPIIKTYIRDIILKLYYKNFIHIFPIGSDSYAHYQRLGVPKTKLSKVLFSVDVEFFEHQKINLLLNKADLRAELGIPVDANVIIYVGKMAKNKSPFLLVESLRYLPTHLKSNCWLLAVGDGPLRYQFESAALEVLPNRCKFVGFANQSQLAKYYSLADLLVLPSRETWGLVVNEAIQFGLKVISSSCAGCSADLVHGNPNGRVFEFPNAQSLSTCIKILLRQKYISIKLNLPKPESLANAVSKVMGTLNKSRA